MRTLSLALRNLLRNRRRSLTTLFAMVIGAVTILIFGGFSRDITYGLQTGYVLRGGHLQVQKKDYFLYGTGNPAAYGIVDYQKVIDVIKADPVLQPLLTVVTPTISLGGIAGNFAAGVSRTIIGSGVAVEDRNKMRQWNDYGMQFNVQPSPLTGSAPDAVVVGTDRVSANGDVANKIGTYMVAVLARRHNIPFYVACPLSTIDMSIADGHGIPIEERDAHEVTGFRDAQWAAHGVKVRNPAFDVTPAELVTGLITEKGLVFAPDRNKLTALFAT